MTNNHYNFRLILTYFTFRLLVAVSFVTMGFTEVPFKLASAFQSQEFLLVSAAYLVLTLTMHLYMLAKAHTPNKNSVFLAIITDVLFCLGFLYLAGGFSTDLAVLLLLPIIVASIFFYGAFAFFIAAISTIGMLANIIWFGLQNADQSQHFVPAGLLGLLFFTASFATQLIAKHIRKTEEIASLQQDLSNKLEQINQRIIQKMQTGIIVVDPNGTILLANDSAKQLLAQDNLLQQALPPAIGNALQQWLQQNQKLSPVIKLSQGSPMVHINFSYVQPTLPNSDIILFIQDQSLLTQQAQRIKLASLGRLSANIAHEIRNPLSAINHASQLLAEDTSIEPSNKRLLDIVLNHTSRINNIINNVQSISVRQTADITRVDMHKALQSAIEQVQQSKLETIDYQLNQQCSKVQVPFDEGQLLQVLTILIDNAITHRQEASKTQIHFDCVMHDDKVTLRIKDNNAVIPSEELDKIFEPFYTTSSKGTGLGLYICKELCEMNQAWLDYVNHDNQYGYFQIRFAHIEKQQNIIT